MIIVSAILMKSTVKIDCRPTSYLCHFNKGARDDATVTTRYSSFGVLREL
jgi:hypothetical protein